MRRPTTRRALATFVATIAILGAACGSDDDGNVGTDMPEEVEQAVDDYIDAWNTYDGEAFMAATTEDYIMHTERYGDWTQERQATVVGDANTHDWHSEWVGEPIVTGDGPWYIASAAHITADLFPEGEVYGVSTIMVVDDDGTPKVARHTFQAEYYE